MSCPNAIPRNLNANSVPNKMEVTEFASSQARGEIPLKYLELLNDADKKRLLAIRDTLSSCATRNCRNKRAETFSDTLIILHRFCMRNSKSDWKRALACGVFWHGQYLCINMVQLHTLLGKCKSSINGSLHSLQLEIVSNRAHCVQIITSALPYLRSRPEEIRKWSVRVHRPAISVPFIPSRFIPPLSHCSDFQAERSDALPPPDSPVEELTYELDPVVY